MILSRNFCTITVRYKKGFTLIELLVVIAIIGVLASIVLAAMSTTRDKADNAVIQSNLTHARAQIAMYYDTSNQSYEINNLTNSVCINGIASTPKGIHNFVTASDNLNGTGLVICNDDPTHWAVAAQFKGIFSSQYYCTDSAGSAKVISGVVGGIGATDFTPGALVCP